MSDEQSFSAGDFRSHAVDSQRDHEKKHKWALGEFWGPGRREEDGHARPARIWSYAGHGPQRRGLRRDGMWAAAHKARARKSAKGDIQEHVSSDGSTDEEVDNSSFDAPAPDADITYSFDAKQGPGHGSQILSHALDKAIERFEVRATDKLVREEYEVLDSEGESVGKHGRGKNKKRIDEGEEEFELI